MDNIKSIIENIWDDRSLLSTQDSKDAIRSVVEMVDQGKLRVAEPDG